MAIRNRISEIRRAAGISQSQLAASVGATLSMIGKLERGERELTQKWIEKFASALNCDPIEILYKASEPISVGVVDDRGRVTDTDYLWQDLEGLDEFNPAAPNDPRMTRLRAVSLTGSLHVLIPSGATFLVRFCDIVPEGATLGRLSILDIPRSDGSLDSVLGMAMPGTQPGLYHVQTAGGQMLADQRVNWSIPIHSIQFP